MGPMGPSMCNSCGGRGLGESRKAMGPMGTSMCNSCGGRGLRESICGLHHESVFRGGQKRVGECRYIRMCVAGLMGRDCGGGGACRAALQPQTHNFLSLQCTIGRGGGGRGVCRYTNVCCWGDGARLQRGRRVPSSAATSNPQLPLPPVHNGAGRRRRAAHGRYCVALCRRACGTVDFGGRLQTQP
jgi:hypothetical protein